MEILEEVEGRDGVGGEVEDGDEGWGEERIGGEKGWEKPYNWEGGGGKGESLDITISLLKRLSQIT